MRKAVVVVEDREESTARELTAMREVILGVLTRSPAKPNITSAFFSSLFIWATPL